MATLRMNTAGVTPALRITLQSDTTCCHYPLFSHAEMAALKLITVGVQLAL